METGNPSIKTSEARKTLDHFGMLSVVVIGESMFPAIKKGERIIVEGRKTPRIGDAVLIDTPDGFLIHRIAGAFHMGGKRWIIHAGDNSRIPGIAGCDQVIGTARCPARATPLTVRTSMYIILLKGCCAVVDIAGCSAALFGANFKASLHTFLKRITVGARLLSV